jgi:beta-glucosidase
VPVPYNHKNTGRPANDTVKYTSRYIDLPSSPQYPFGYGLSYTRFAYLNLKTSPAVVESGDTVRVTVEVQNTGTREGEEVVQLYVRDDVATTTRPVKELKRFARIGLTPGESRSVTFPLPVSELATYDLALRHVVEPGSFTVSVGGNSRDCLETRFIVAGGR